jgi:Predicted membrane protein
VSNPVFNRDPMFNGRGAVVAQTVDAATLEEMYARPAATPRETGRMTYDDVIVRTAGMLAVLVVAAAVTWLLAPQLYVVGAIGGFVLALVNSFKKEPSPVLMIAYAVLEGVFVGGLSAILSAWVEIQTGASGIVTQAVLATMATFAVSLWLYRSGRVRVTPKFTRWLMIALLGYLAFSLVNLVLSFFVTSGDFGPLRSGTLGIVAGLVAVGLAAAALISDFDAVKRGVEAGVPRTYAWTGAFGLTVTLVWLYVEFLRLLAIFASDR